MKLTTVIEIVGVVVGILILALLLGGGVRVGPPPGDHQAHQMPFRLGP